MINAAKRANRCVMRCKAQSKPLPNLISLALGVIALGGEALAFAGSVKPRLDLFSNFAPFWLLSAAASLIVSLAFGSKRAKPLGLCLALCGIAAAGALLLPEYLRPTKSMADPGANVRLKLIQLNAWRKNRSPDQTAEWLSAQSPDIVTLEDAGSEITKAMLKRGFMVKRGGADTAIFTRGLKATSAFVIPDADWPSLPDFALGRYETGGEKFTVIAVHLERPIKGSHIGDAEMLFTLLHRTDESRAIVAGDFNLTPWSFSLRRLDQVEKLERRDRALFTWPVRWPSPNAPLSPVPFMPIDHIYAGASWKTVAVTRGPALGSSHYPIIITLALSH